MNGGAIHIENVNSFEVNNIEISDCKSQLNGGAIFFS